MLKEQLHNMLPGRWVGDSSPTVTVSGFDALKILTGMFQPKGNGNQMITNFSIKKGKNIMTNTFKNNTLENKIEVLKEINAETAGWGINELLMENCDYYSSWHMNHMDETYAKLAKAYSYEELVERLNDWKEDPEDEASD